MGLDSHSMFTEFSRYQDMDYLLAHRTVVFATPEKTSWMSVRAVEITRGNDKTKRTDIKSRDELLDWYSRRYEAASIKCENPDDEQIERVLTLVTCSYNYSRDERTLIYALDVSSL
jgi:hypothetical protein